MKKLISALIIIFFLICTISKAQNENYRNEIDSIKIDNIYRTYESYVPKDIVKRPKLVFVLHGSTMSTKQMLKVTGNEFNREVNPFKNRIIVYPQGFGNYWNDCRKSATYEANLLNLNEAEFFKTIITKFEKNYSVDKNEIFIVGWSNGGQMVYKLAKENPNLFKGFAVINANLPVESNNDCFSKNESVSLLIANGTADSINPYNGGKIVFGDGKNRGSVISTINSVNYWKGLMDCKEVIETKKELPDLDKSDSSTVTIYDYVCEKDGKKIELIEIKNGGHHIPNPSFNEWAEYLGNLNKDINLPLLILDFFDSLE